MVVYICKESFDKNSTEILTNKRNYETAAIRKIK